MMKPIRTITVTITAVCFIVLYLVACASTTKNQEPEPVSSLTTTEATLSSVTNTPVPEVTPQPIWITPTPTITRLVEVTKQVPILQGPLVAFVENASKPTNSIFLFDQAADSIRRLQVSGGIPRKARWSSDGCRLYVTLRTATGIKLVSTDLQGNVLRDLFQYTRGEPSREVGTFLDGWTLSPSGEYLAYIVFSGKQYYATSEFQNIEVVTIGERKQPFTLTTRGGALGLAWSPDGKRIAYSDYDALGVRQLYQSNFDGSSKIQLTQFTDKGTSTDEPKGNYIGTPIWSPDGKTIAFEAGISDVAGNTVSTLWLVSAKGDKQLQVAPRKASQVTIMGWSEDNTSLAVYMFGDRSSDLEDSILYWVNVMDGKMLGTLESGKVLKNDVVLLAAIKGVQVWVGEGIDGTKYLYDATTKTLERKEKLPWPGFRVLVAAQGIRGGEAVAEGQIIDASISPSEFRGEGQCAR